MIKLIIIRGIPGSGKTTLAKSVGSGIYYEADQYFNRPDGQYDFNPTLLKNAHEWCYSQVRTAFKRGTRGTVTVSNTFTRLWEMQKYIDLAKEFGAELVVYRCVGRYQNIHGVPEEKVNEMLTRFQDYEGEIIYGN